MYSLYNCLSGIIIVRKLTVRILNQPEMYKIAKSEVVRNHIVRIFTAREFACQEFENEAVMIFPDRYCGLL